MAKNKKPRYGGGYKAIRDKCQYILDVRHGTREMFQDEVLAWGQIMMDDAPRMARQHDEAAKLLNMVRTSLDPYNHSAKRYTKDELFDMIQEFFTN